MTSATDSRPVAVVIGAARGISLAIARWLLERDWRVVLTHAVALPAQAPDPPS